jgi:ureidoglycolate lyase
MVIAEPLHAESFAPYGDVLEAPKEAGRVYFNGSLGNDRIGAAPSLSIVNVQTLITLPHTATRMERHEFSSQTFLPLDVGRWLAIVAPKTDQGMPDATKARAFLVGPGQGVTYRPDTWHHPLAVLDRPARFAVFMWLDGSSTDEEFVTLDRPFIVTVPA